MKNKTLALSLILTGFLLFSGASCGQKQYDGGIFKSTDAGETWEQKVYLGMQKNKPVTISNLDLRRIVFAPYTLNDFWADQKQKEAEENTTETTSETNEETLENTNQESTEEATIETEENIEENTDETTEDILVQSPEIYITTYANGVYKTDQAAEQWQATNFTTGFHIDLAINPKNGDEIFTCVGKNIYRTEDRGEYWDNIYTDPKGEIMNLLIDHYNPQYIYAFTTAGTIIKSDNSGIDWHLIYQADDGLRHAAMNPFDSRIIYALDNSGVLYKTSDAGANWITINHRKNNPDYFKQFEGIGEAKEILTLVTDPVESNTIYATSKAGLAKSTDGGTTWQMINTLIPPNSGENEQILNFMINPQDPQIMYFTVNDQIYKSIDRGQTWKTIENFPSNRQIKVMQFDPINPDVMYAGVRLLEEGDNNPFTPN